MQHDDHVRARWLYLDILWAIDSMIANGSQIPYWTRDHCRRALVPIYDPDRTHWV